MSFLDSLENNLKALEAHDEGGRPNLEDRKRREEERANVRAAQPWAEQLKTGPFTAALLDHATRLGHEERIKVRILWIGTALRLEARARRLELRPTAGGVVAVFIEEDGGTREEPVDLTGDPEKLARAWLRPA